MVKKILSCNEQSSAFMQLTTSFFLEFSSHKFTRHRFSKIPSEVNIFSHFWGKMFAHLRKDDHAKQQSLLKRFFVVVHEESTTQNTINLQEKIRPKSTVTIKYLVFKWGKMITMILLTFSLSDHFASHRTLHVIMLSVQHL